MRKLTALIMPEDKNILPIEVSAGFCRKVKKLLEEKRKNEKTILEFEEPDFGLYGFELISNEEDFCLIANRKYFVYTNSEKMIEVYSDIPDNKIFKLLFVEINKKYSKETIFYIELENVRAKRKRSSMLNKVIKELDEKYNKFYYFKRF